MPQLSNLCIECGIRPVAIKKRKLCKPCYNRLYRRDGFLKVRQTDAERAAEKINRASEKYGSDFIQDLELLKKRPYWTIRVVAQKYGISPERVRQLFKIAFDESYSKYLREKRAKVNADIALLDTHCNMYHKVSKRGVGKVKAFEKCIELGFETYWAAGRADLVVNGYQVGVSSNFRKLKRANQNRTEYFHFMMAKSKVESIDFFIFLAVLYDRWFIIPSEIFKEKFVQRNKWAVYIPEKRINDQFARSTYCQYESAWGQLAGSKGV